MFHFPAPEPSSIVLKIPILRGKIMQSIPWRSTCRLRNHLFNSVYSAQFHSTPVLSAKWRRKWDECKYDKRDQKPSKSYMKYVGRQNRAERKKALKNYLHNGITSKMFEDEGMNSRFRIFGKSRPHYSWQSQKDQNSGRKTWQSRDYFSESDGHESDSNFNPFVGSSANRAALELPTSGPLKLEDVKIAFRAAALRWHPDKHCGPSQATAAEKFKLCVNAYQSLCNDLQAS